MSQATPQVRGRDARVPLGIPELDEMLEGGLMPHRPYLLVGPSGTGKTTLGLQFLCEGVRRGEKGLYVTLEDPPNEVRFNHRALRPTLDAVDVFDAIPDVMRYERVPFKDISAVRHVLPFGQVADRIRPTPEFSSVEITGTALEQMLRTEVLKRGYVRMVIDSLTALQYFCMKGFDPTVGAQTFLRFLTELRTTTLLTVESPLEDIETPERMLARGEIRLFRWELDGTTVRAVGVEKFRGSAHDVRLHPYRIGPRGIDIQLAQTISRDTRRIVEPAIEVALRGEGPSPAAPVPEPAVAVPVEPPELVEPLSEQIRDLVRVGVDVRPLRPEVEAALGAVRAGRTEEVAARIARLSAMTIALAPVIAPPTGTGGMPDERVQSALRRIAARSELIREGRPPWKLPSEEMLDPELTAVLALLPTEVTERFVAPAPRAEAVPPEPPAPPGATPPPSPEPALADVSPPIPEPERAPTALEGRGGPAVPPEAVPPPVAQPARPAEPTAPSPGPHDHPPVPESAAPSTPVRVAPLPAEPLPSAPSAAPSATAAAPVIPGPSPLSPPRPSSEEAVARAAALLGEPIRPVARPGPAAHAPAKTAARSVRAAAAPPLPAPPPLPVAPRPPPGSADRPAGPGASTDMAGRPAAWTPPAGSPAVAAPPGPTAAGPAAPKRRRRGSGSTTSRAGAKISAPGTTPAEGAEPGAAAKPRRRVLRRKKAPPVVGASPESPPPAPEEAPPRPAGEPSPEDRP